MTGLASLAALTSAPYVSAEYSVKAAPATRIVQDGDIIDLGDRHFEVIHATCCS